MTSVKNKRRLLYVSVAVLIVLLISSMLLTLWTPNSNNPAEPSGPQRLATFGNTATQTLPTQLTETEHSIIFDTQSTQFEFNKQDPQTIVNNAAGDFLAKEQVHLEVYTEGDWRSAGKLVDHKCERINEHIYKLTKTYESSFATWQTIYDLMGDHAKLTVEITAKTAANYRIIWTFDLPPNFKGQIEKERITSDEFYLDWSDVKQNFGDISKLSSSKIENGQRQVITFDIGHLNADEQLSLDPSFGNRSQGNLTFPQFMGNQIFGSVFTLPEDGYALSISTDWWFSMTAQGDSPLFTYSVASAIISYPDMTLVAQTHTQPVNQNPLSGNVVIALNSPVFLKAGEYVLASWVSMPHNAEWGLCNLIQTKSLTSANRGLLMGSSSPDFQKFATDATVNNAVYAIFVNYESTSQTLNYSDIGHDTTMAGAAINFRSTWRDVWGLSHYVFSTNLTGVWQNDTARFTVNPQSVTVSKVLPARTGDTIMYRWYANNTANQWASTYMQQLTTTSEYTPIRQHQYTIMGPYLETGAVLNGTVQISINYPYQPSITYTLNGTNGTADVFNVPSNNFATNVVWNITSDGVVQRSFNFNPNVASETVRVTVPDHANAFQTTSMYRVHVTDFAGLSNGFASVMRNIEGVSTVVESKPLDPYNAIPFYLINNQQYMLKVSSDQGSWTFNFPTDGVLEKNFVITKDMVPVKDPTSNVAVNVERPGSEVIRVSVVDSLDDSAIIVTEIFAHNGREWQIAYIQTDMGSQEVFWQQADPNIDYLVTVNVHRGSEAPLLWQRSAPAAGKEMQFTGYFEVLGKWPFPANQLVGLFIVGLFFTLFSWRDTEAACLIGCIVAGVCVILGLLSVPVTAIAMGFFVVVALYIHQGKKGEFNAV